MAEGKSIAAIMREMLVREAFPPREQAQVINLPSSCTTYEAMQVPACPILCELITLLFCPAREDAGASKSSLSPGEGEGHSAVAGPGGHVHPRPPPLSFVRRR